MKADRLWAAGMQTLVQMVYPPRCLSCGGLVESDFGLCATCWRDTPFIAGLSCDLCGAPLPGQSDRAEHCDDCLRTARPWQHGRAALLYEGIARRLVLALKHGDRQDIAKPAARWMARASRDLASPDLLVIPIPLHVQRHLGRRYNQSALLAQALAAELRCDWCPDALLRPQATPSLDGRGREERFDILTARIRPNPDREDRLCGHPVLIVDDVMTSGATLSAAAEAAIAAGASSVCISVLARVAKQP